MDCQNESYSDLESLKANKRFICAQCTEEFRSHSDKEAGTGEPPALNEHFESYLNPLNESSAQAEIPVQDEEVLEIPEAVFISEHSEQAIDDNVILFPEIETQTPLSWEEIYLDQTDNSLQVADSPMSENSSVQVSQEADFTDTLPEQGTAVASDPQILKGVPLKEVASIKKMRLMAFSTSKQIVIAVACVLSIILMQQLITPSSQVSVKAESSDRTVSQAATEVEHKEVKEVSAPAPVSENSPTPPAPTPAPAIVAEAKPVEEKPVVASSTTGQPVETQKGLYTLQVGSHQNVAEANDQANKLRAAGLEPRVVSAEIPKRGVWYRVQIGDFSTRDEANSFGATLRTKGLADNFIVSGQ
jgi:cell division protein FtsN